MLVLSRKAGQKIMIGDGISVVVNRVAGNRVAIGIEAPQGVRILRGELQPQDEAPAQGGAQGGGKRSLSVVSPPVADRASVA